MNQDQGTTAFWKLAVEETETSLKTNAHTGLTQEEAAARLAQTGPNELREQEKKSLLARFVDQFRNFMVVILLVAAAISGVSGYLEGEGITDALIILAIVVVNACIGLFQEAKAENALEALRNMSAPHCRVVRGGTVMDIAAKDLVPGDVALLETGALVPADMRLVEAVNLKIQESSLTGESVPVEKNTTPVEGDALPGDRVNMAFSSGIVTFGRGRGIVTATGMESEIGRIAGMIQQTPDARSPMQQRLDQLGKYLGLGAMAVCAIIFLAGYLQGRELFSMFMIAVSLAVAAIPEGLTAVSTVVLAVGMQRLAKRNAIVRTLASVETLGSTTCICSDKTGTLTQNRMTVTALYAGNTVFDPPHTLPENQRELLLGAILANDAAQAVNNGTTHSMGDPTETALVDFGPLIGLDKNELEKINPRQAELPFDSGRKMMSTVNRRDTGTYMLYTKGGADEVLARCTHIWLSGSVVPLDEKERENIREQNRIMAEKALRVLAVAYKPLEAAPPEMTSEAVEQGLVFACLVGMIDPPRQEARDAVQTCRAAGIRPVMITGDHVATAIAIAEQVGIKQAGDSVMTGLELDRATDGQLKQSVANTAVFARVAPEHKVRIVRALRERGEVVAMTGDGVNDAPALKLADIGVAMGITGTDVSKQAADVVLADDNFATIVAAVGEGRRIYDNILKAVQFLLSTNVGEVLVIFIAIMAGWPTPLLPVQILWVNLVTDSLPALALSVEPAEKDIMRRRPSNAGNGTLRGLFLARVLLQGIMIAALTLVAFRVGSQVDEATGRTMAFAVLALCQVAHAFNVRSTTASAFDAMFGNRPLVLALAITMALMLIVLLVPGLHEPFGVSSLGPLQWSWVAGLSVMPLIIVESVKFVARRKSRAASTAA